MYIEIVSKQRLSDAVAQDGMLVGPFADWLNLAVTAVHSNLFGLGCPFYCHQPGFGSLLACFLLGCLVGAGSVAYLGWIIRPHTNPNWLRPAGYLDAPELVRRGKDIIELSCKFQQLDIAVKGPASQASKFLASVTSGSLAGRAPSPGASEFEVVGSASGSVQPDWFFGKPLVGRRGSSCVDSR